MIRLNHLTIPVKKHSVSREWYTSNLGLKVEFEVPERKTVALQDDGDLTLFLVGSPQAQVTPCCTLAFQVDDVEVKYRELSARGVNSKRHHRNSFGDMVPNYAIPMATLYIFGTNEQCVRKAANKRPNPALQTDERRA